MSIFQSIILGLVQGFTEFLPISSSGHLVMFQNFFGIEDELFISIALHLGTLIAVIIVFFEDIKQMILHPFSPLVKKLALATIPTILLVLILKPLVESSFSSQFYILGFVITAIILFATEKSKKVQKPIGTPISYKNSFWIGVAQGLACFPGISRSGSTICMGVLQGENRDEVAKFSFLLSIPIIVASSLYELIFHQGAMNLNVLPMIIGMLVSIVSGIIAIKWMLKLVSKAKFYYFSVYLLSLSVILVIVYNLII